MRVAEREADTKQAASGGGTGAPLEPDVHALLGEALGSGCLQDEGWRLLAERAVRLQAPAGRRLFQAGDPCREFLLVLQGCIRVQYLDETGNEIVLYRVRAGETCILTTSCLLGDADYPAEGLVEEDLVATAVTLPVFRRALASEAVRNFVFAAMGRRLVDLMLRIDELAFRRLDRRLARHLLDRRTAVVHTTHQDIAVELGSAREVVSRLLKDFERKGWVRLGRGRIEILHAGALAALAGD